MPNLDFAASDEEAAERAEEYLANDPFRSIPEALLSSAEIHDYARVTGMLHPFYPGLLKSASYEAHVGGLLIYWDENGKRHEKEINRGGECILKSDSITFIQVEPKFRLPNYIAMRFNLRITHVHRGLLLGTGPLVDPGFEGKLLIPLHNLTSSDYALDTNEALIWIEFTKTTFGFTPKEKEAEPDRSDIFSEFPDAKKNRSADQYLRRANGGNAIRSSIPSTIVTAKDAAVRAQQSASTASLSALGFGGVGLVVVVVAAATLAIALYQYYGQFQSMVHNAAALTKSVSNDVSDVAKESATNLVRIELLQKDLMTTEAELNKLKSEFRMFQQSLSPRRPTLPQ